MSDKKLEIDVLQQEFDNQSPHWLAQRKQQRIEAIRAKHRARRVAKQTGKPADVLEAFVRDR
jgi:hypothetical protein